MISSFGKFERGLRREEQRETGSRRRGRPPLDPDKAPDRPFVGCYVDADTHAALKEIARRDRRTMASLCRVIFDKALAGQLIVLPRS